jgi:hypothetical protein
MSFSMPSLNEALARIDGQSLEDDLRTIDDLYGRDTLQYGATQEEVKEECKRQVEQDFNVARAYSRANMPKFA